MDLYNEYTYIRAYHACRPLDIQKYLSDGIQVPSRKQALNEALVRICPSNVTDADVKKQFNANWKDAESKVSMTEGDNLEMLVEKVMELVRNVYL